MVEQLLKFGRIVRPALGISIAPVPLQLQQRVRESLFPIDFFEICMGNISLLSHIKVALEEIPGEGALPLSWNNLLARAAGQDLH